MSAQKHMVQLDALRGIAALIVVISHAANAFLLPSALGQGFGQMGVGIFYILSAFLLTTLYADRDLTRATAYDYLVRRGARVLPLFYAALFTSLLVQWLTGISVYEAFASVRTFLGNALLVQGTSVLWSIPVEIQFYLIFLGFWRLRRRNLGLAFGYLIAVQVLLYLLAKWLGASEHSLPFWMHYFTLGCAFGLIAKNTTLKSDIVSSKLFQAVVLIAVAGTLIVLPGVRREYLGLSPLETYRDPLTVAWTIAVSAAFVFGLVRSKWVAHRIFGLMGELSFSVYLIHMALILAVTSIARSDFILPYDRFLLVLVGTYAVSFCVTRLFERPVQKALLRALLPRKETPK